MSLRLLMAQVDLDKAYRFPNTEILETVRIKKVVEGPNGFVWIVTGEGIFRFDGSQLKLMFDGHFEDMDIDKVNGQFIFTSRKEMILHSFSGSATEFVPTSKIVEGDYILQSAVVIDDSTCLIGSSYGLTYYHLRDGTTRSVQLFGADGKYDHVTVVERDPVNADVVWAGTKSGLYKYSLDSGNFERYWLDYEDNDREVALNLLDALYIHSDGNIYWGSWGAGLVIFDPQTGEYAHYLDELGNRENSHVYAITPESDSSIWISSTTGAANFNPMTDALQSYLKSDLIQDPVVDIGPVMIDKTGKYWIGYANGLRLYDPGQDPIETLHCPLMTNLTYYIPRNLSFGTDPNLLFLVVDFSEGLYTYNLRDKQWQCYFVEGITPGTELRVWDAYWGGDTLWILHDQGLYLYKEGAKALREIPLDLTEESYRFRSFASFRNDEIWMTSNLRGLHIAYPSRGELKVYNELDALKNYDFLQHVDKLHYDRNGVLWLGYKDHLYTFTPKTSSFLDLSATVNEGQPFLRIHDIYEDDRGVWLSTYSGAYLLQEMGDGNYKSTRIAEVSSNNIITDTEGNAWLTTGRSVTKIDINTELSQRYTKTDGLPNTGRYGYDRIDRLKKDRLILSGRKTFAIFRPDDLSPSPDPPRPYIASVSVDGIEAQLSSLGLSLNYLNIKPEQNSVSIDFSAISFSSRSNNKFRYKLAGINDDWIVNAAGGKGPTYVNLEGGSYRFYVEATGSGEDWSAPAIIEIDVGEYWWERMGVQVVLACMGLGLLFALYRRRLNVVRNENAIQMQVADLERKALKAQMNPHFIFNAMNSIQNLIAKGDEKRAMFYLGRFGRLLRSVLDTSDQNYVSLSKELELLENYILLESLRFRDTFKYNIDADSALEHGDIKIPGFIIQPVVENAIQHGLIPKKGDGELKITIRHHETYLNCIIEDNGVGRHAVKSTENNSNKSSVGLKILQSRLALHNKGQAEHEMIHIEDLYSEDGTPAGTRVNLTLPVQT